MVRWAEKFITSNSNVANINGYCMGEGTIYFIKGGIETMPTCQNCSRKWSWKQTLKKSFNLDTGMICPYCEKKQEVTKGTRLITALFTFIVLTLVTIGSLLYGPSIIFVYILISAALLFVVLYPFWLELRDV